MAKISARGCRPLYHATKVLSDGVRCVRVLRSDGAVLERFRLPASRPGDRSTSTGYRLIGNLLKSPEEWAAWYRRNGWEVTYDVP